jgi:hypothetical protein
MADDSIGFTAVYDDADSAVADLDAPRAVIGLTPVRCRAC